MLPKFYFLIILGFFVINVNAVKYIGPLTEKECKAYLASNNINKRLQAVFSCPKKWRTKHKCINFIQIGTLNRLTKRTLLLNQNIQ
ncbi:unnamed protein product [Rotaria sordida]|uniref:Uncharacterized protein n=1 Tax=Rotaria sordida TaxID=392033 RepID=A0A813Y1G2_9BILA|nr:unnamed protein product [Rotaria sordida]CAF0875396.1 unnamed protein product [Rotaria sordida]CAF1003121.1 unnamed protein product [Rotaria sordida]CAF1183592.1 unnamed protein product [Rotaria sordida]